jgi:hypothetical protein
MTMFVEQYAGPNGEWVSPGNVLNSLTDGTGERVRFDPGMRRPYFDKNGNPAVTINTGRWTTERGVRVPVREHRLIRDLMYNGIMNPVWNATSLRKEEWLELDRQVLTAARYRLRLWEDIKKAGVYGGFNGMSKMILEHETMSDPGEAIVDMDGLTEGRTDAPKFQLEGLPLPITHSDFWYSQRRLTISRNSGTPLDTISGETAGQRIGENIEKTALGLVTGPIYGGNSTQNGGYGRTAQVYGLTNFPARLTKTNLNTPTGSNASSTLSDVLAMKDQLVLNKFYGPWMIYHSNDWDQYLDNDYILSGGNVATATLRERLKAIDNVQDVKRIDMLFATQPQTNQYWTTSNVGTTGIAPYRGPGGELDASLKPFTLLMVQMTPNVVRAVDGMSITTVQWESVGGMRLNFKTMCIQVPQIRADHYGNCGILHATTS